jgi:hypothetical protein
MTEKIKQNDFHQNQKSYAEVLADFRTKLAAVSSHGPVPAIEKHRSRGKSRTFVVCCLQSIR